VEISSEYAIEGEGTLRHFILYPLEI